MIRSATLTLTLLVLCACHKRAGKEFFGTQVAAPGILAHVKPGMTLEQLRAIAPDLKDDPPHGTLLAQPASNVKLYALLLEGVVHDIYVDYEGADGMAVLTAAWGPPDAEHDREDPKDPAWRSTVTGWRAHVYCGNGTKETPLPPYCTINFFPHQPLEAMFGKAIAPPGELAKATLGMPLAALKAATNLPFEDGKVTSRKLAYDGANESVSIADGELTGIDYRVPTSARAAIDKAWGPPVVTADGETLWSDANTGWSVVSVHHKEDPDQTTFLLHFIGYQPFEKTIDLLVALSAFKSVAEARAAHPELEWRVNKDTPYLKLPSNEFSGELQRGLSNPVSVNTSTSGAVFLSMMLDGAKETDVVASLTKRWGAPKIEKRPTNESVLYSWDGHASLLRARGGELDLELGDR